MGSLSFVLQLLAPLQPPTEEASGVAKPCEWDLKLFAARWLCLLRVMYAHRNIVTNEMSFTVRFRIFEYFNLFYSLYVLYTSIVDFKGRS
jgi:hypothetical protein